MTSSAEKTNLFSAFITELKKEYGLLETADLRGLILDIKHIQRSADRLADEKRAEIETNRKKEEHISQITSMELPLDYNNAYSTDERALGVFAETIDDGFIMCLNTLGKVDIEYIAQICSTDIKTVILSLKGAIYQDPDTWHECFYKGWKTSDEYLSGNLMRKLETAQEANIKYNGYFEDNIKAIKNVLPAPLQYTDIYVTLGSPWVPAEMITDFIEYIIGNNPRIVHYYDSTSGERKVRIRDCVIHDEITGYWKVEKSISRVYHGTAPTGFPLNG